MPETIWLITRWEGDYDAILGAYSTRQRAIDRSASDFLNFRTTYDREYHLYQIELDQDPENLDNQFETITHSHAKPT